jgi:transcriptional regulator with XRE-family HTH domain
MPTVARPDGAKEFMPNTGKRLRWAREASGISQSEIARRLDVDRSTLSKYEQGLRMLDPTVAARLGRMLGVSLDCLYLGLLGRWEQGISLMLAAPHPELVTQHGATSRPRAA